MIQSASAIIPVPERGDLDQVRQQARALCALLDPEWRYTRARSMKTDGVVRFRSSEDPWVVDLTSFLNRYEIADTAALDRLERRHPDIFWAFNIHSMESRGPRYHLEAMVLTGKPVDEIAAYLALPDAVVLAYEQLFFDLRRHLASREGIRTYISARARARGLRDMDPDPFWKRIALAEGESLLFAIWDDGVLEDTHRHRIDALIESDARRNAVEAMRVRHIDARNAHEIIEEYIAIIGNETDRKKLEAEMGASTGVEKEFVAGLIHAVQFSVAAVGEGSKSAYIEVSEALSQAPALLERLQGSAMEAAHVEVPEPDSN